jgi:hypothetical protein
LKFFLSGSYDPVNSLHGAQLMQYQKDGRISASHLASGQLIGMWVFGSIILLAKEHGVTAASGLRQHPQAKRWSCIIHMGCLSNFDGEMVTAGGMEEITTSLQCAYID